MKYSIFSRFRTVGNKPKTIKLPSQKSQSPISFSDAIDNSALKHSRDTLGDAPQYLGFSDKSIREMAGESIALKTESRSYFSNLKKGLQRERRYQANQIKSARTLGSAKMMRKQKSSFVVPKQKLQSKYKKTLGKYDLKLGQSITENPQGTTIFRGTKKIRKIPKYKLSQDIRFSKLNKKVSDKSQNIYSKTLEKFTGKAKGSSFKNNILKEEKFTIEDMINKRKLKSDWGF